MLTPDYSQFTALLDKLNTYTFNLLHARTELTLPEYLRAATQKAGK